MHELFSRADFESKALMRSTHPLCVLLQILALSCVYLFAGSYATGLQWYHILLAFLFGTYGLLVYATPPAAPEWKQLPLDADETVPYDYIVVGTC